MAIVHSFTKYKDVYTLSNQGVASFNYKLLKVDCSGEETVVIDTTLLSNTIDEGVPIPITIDGSYILVLSQTGQQDILIPITSYNNLLISFIKDVKSLLCGCHCVDCNCEEDCENTLLTLSKAIAYFNLNSSDISTIYSCVSETTNCEVEQDVNCMLTNEVILGHADSSNIINILVANYYLSFYYYELNNALNAEEVSFIKDKYLYSTIIKCIKKLGINTTNIPCNPPVIEDQVCKQWSWDLSILSNPDTIVSIKYYECGTNEEVTLTDTVRNLGDTVTVCTNGTQPIINIGTLSSDGNCAS